MNILRAVEYNQSIQEDQFADLIDDYGTPVYRLCKSLAYHKQDADDLFQDTFLKAYERREKLSGSESPQSFLLSITLYIWKSRKRRYARRKRLAPEELYRDQEAAENRQDKGEPGEAELDAVRTMVSSLPDKFRIPMILYYTVNMGIPEIALTLGVPEGTVKSRLFTGRKLVERELGESADE